MKWMLTEIKKVVYASFAFSLIWCTKVIKTEIKFDKSYRIKYRRYRDTEITKTKKNWLNPLKLKENIRKIILKWK